MRKSSEARSASGTVVSNKMDKTITVLVERRVKHPIYGKYIKRSNKIHAHDPENVCQEGDLVTIEETKPISKSKAWKLSSVDRKATII
ncbi:MAG TPA: 30S ribosomal protein S17 [Pseudomonadales bacterium]|jgi:small subunit ribosomal protein S17|nr:30S ribosomal protein S17 [Gammaproteobacteria bacterium]MDP6024725.1 30S ribosomal protein S17 [Pseudomonadales bacterium]MDP6317295.1 30S ribosomal protein S17 [Pseudomonadales bacterium]MDP7315466.1 30S ribosomal protein S17 [Pseudomonadales bacterium]HJL62000.1 30S ribosomal protein S17 [Pseudomonadales bacterium]|tara:strand:- start:395 stop:658 length:264 start_codon:yes stop_codon:yes gene_type:complete